MLLLYQGCAQRNNVGNSKTLSRPRAKPSRRWPQDSRELISTRRSWFTNGMAGRAELDRGRGLRDKCKSLSKTTWSHHERRQNNSVEMSFKDLRQVLFLSYEENMISDEEVLLLCDEYSRRTQNLNLWFQPPENSRFEVRDRSSRTSWQAQWLSCCKNTSGWHARYQEWLVLKFPNRKL